MRIHTVYVAQTGTVCFTQPRTKALPLQQVTERYKQQPWFSFTALHGKFLMQQFTW